MPNKEDLSVLNTDLKVYLLAEWCPRIPPDWSRSLRRTKDSSVEQHLPILRFTYVKEKTTLDTDIYHVVEIHSDKTPVCNCSSFSCLGQAGVSILLDAIKVTDHRKSIFQ